MGGGGWLKINKGLFDLENKNIHFSSIQAPPNKAISICLAYG